jgi:hypothetical protein
MCNRKEDADFLLEAANRHHELEEKLERLRKTILTAIHDLNTAGCDDLPPCKNSFFIGMVYELKQALAETEAAK